MVSINHIALKDKMNTLIFPDPFPEIEYIRRTFLPGNFVVYSYRGTNDGRKHTCSVVGISDDGWVLDKEKGTCFSQSFRLKDVVVWEHGKARKSK